MKTDNPFSEGHNKENAAEGGGSFLGHFRAAIAATIILGIICCGIYPAVVWGIAQAIFPNQANGSLVKKDGTPTTGDQDAVGSALLGQVFTQPGYFHPRPSATNNSPGSSYAPTGGYDPTASGGSNFGPLSDELINGLTTSPVAPATQPAEFLAYDGVRLRTMHYAMDNNISFKLYHARYVKQDDGSVTIEQQEEVPLAQFQNADKSLNDIKLVDAFPHPYVGGDAPNFTRQVVITRDFSTPIPGDAVTASGSGLDPHISIANAEIQKTRVAAARNITAEQVQALIDAHTDRPSLGVFGDPGVKVLMLNIALDKQYPMAKP